MSEEQGDTASAAGGGLKLPADYGDARAEWEAARSGCAVADLSFRALIEVSGDDRTTFLQGMLSQDVAGISVGAGGDAFFLTDTAKVVTDLRVLVQRQRILLDCLAWRRSALMQGLDRYLVADDVELQGLEELVPLLQLEGPRAAEVVLAVVAATALPDTRCSHLEVSFEGEALMAVAVSEIGGSGIALYGKPDTRAALFAACRSAGATALGRQALTALRLEAGVAWAGVDMGDGDLAMEFARGDAISTTKGCYLGQEVVERVAARGHVNRRKIGVSLACDEVPPMPARLCVAGREVGKITSAVYSFAAEGIVGLGLGHVKYLDREGLVAIAGGSEIPCRIVELPIAAKVA